MCGDYINILLNDFKWCIDIYSLMHLCILQLNVRYLNTYYIIIWYCIRMLILNYQKILCSSFSKQRLNQICHVHRMARFVFLLPRQKEKCDAVDDKS